MNFKEFLRDDCDMLHEAVKVTDVDSAVVALFGKQPSEVNDDELKFAEYMFGIDYFKQHARKKITSVSDVELLYKAFFGKTYKKSVVSDKELAKLLKKTVKYRLSIFKLDDTYKLTNEDIDYLIRTNREYIDDQFELKGISGSFLLSAMLMYGLFTKKRSTLRVKGTKTKECRLEIASGATAVTVLKRKNETDVLYTLDDSNSWWSFSVQIAEAILSRDDAFEYLKRQTGGELAVLTFDEFESEVEKKFKHYDFFKGTDFITYVYSEYVSYSKTDFYSIISFMDNAYDLYAGGTFVVGDKFTFAEVPSGLTGRMLGKYMLNTAKRLVALGRLKRLKVNGVNVYVLTSDADVEQKEKRQKLREFDKLAKEIFWEFPRSAEQEAMDKVGVTAEPNDNRVVIWVRYAMAGFRDKDSNGSPTDAFDRRLAASEKEYYDLAKELSSNHDVNVVIRSVSPFGGNPDMLAENTSSSNFTSFLNG